MADPFYLTTAIHYPNGRPHLGHAYETVAADVLARFQRARGRDVRFQTGTDEHGLKMAQKARDLGLTPRALADEMSGHFRDLFDALGISYDRFFRTSEDAHHRASQALWQAMEANGDLYLDRYEGWYSVRDEAYYDEAELTVGEGGEKLSPQGTPVEWTAEESWFFRLSRYQEPLLALLRDNPDWVQPDRSRNEVMRFVEGGLNDLSVSRTSFDWGVKVPGADEHVMYVWVDALTNYLTGVGYPDDTAMFDKFWPADLHLIGKDIVRFHAVYWPAFLMSAGLPLPKAVFAHGFLLNRGQKESKSLGNVTDPLALAVRCGCAAVLPAARVQLWAGWHLVTGGDHQPCQRGTGQQLRQSGAAGAELHRQELRWHGKRARGSDRCRLRIAGQGRHGLSGRAARSIRTARLCRRSGGLDAGGFRMQCLCR